jgi:PAS domain S-box-containing protein
MPELDYKQLFQFLPERFLVFRTNDPDFTLVDTNRLHAGMAMVDRDEVVGQPFFTVFPDTSEQFKKTGVSALAESMRRVIKTGKADTMEDFRYDIRQQDGSFVERWWRPTHYPLKDAAGKLSFIVQVSHDVTEEIRKEKRLADAQKQLDEALAIGQVGSWIWDIKADRIIADKNLANFFGVSVEEATAGLPLTVFTDSIHPEDKARVEKEINLTVTKTGIFDSEYRTTDKDGRTRWVIARGRIEYDDDSRPMRFPGVLVDITARKEAEEKFKQQLAFTRTITASLGEGVYTLDTEGRVTYMNAAAETILGWTEADLLGKYIHDHIHFQRPDGSKIKRANCPLLVSLKNGEVVHSDDEYFTSKDGHMIAVSVTSAPIMQDGQITGLVQSFNDISERKRDALNLSFLAQASKVLSSSLDYSVTLEQVTDLVVPDIADWCSVEFYNEETKTLDLVGLAHKDPAKVRWARQLRDEYPPDMSARTGSPEVLRTGKPAFYPWLSPEMLDASAKNERERKLLRQLDLSAVIVVPLIIEKKPVGVINFIKTNQKAYTEADLEMAEELANRASIAITNANLYRTAQEEITERRRLEDELREVNELLEQRVKQRTRQLEVTNQSLERSNRELQDFAYVASHDLQEPLRKIQAFGNLLESEHGEQLGAGKDYLNRMRSAASRMSILIEDLLAFSRVTTKARPFVPVELQVVAGEVVGDLETRIEETQGIVDIQSLPTVQADPLQMRQLLQNLIANALKFHQPDVPPIVTLSGKEVLDKNGKLKAYQLEVSDNGIGFDEKYLDRIFAVFQRLHGHEAYEGTGIGLAVCRKIAERHGGTITATSKPGKGARFIITLPAKPPKEV